MLDEHKNINKLINHSLPEGEGLEPRRRQS